MSLTTPVAQIVSESHDPLLAVHPSWNRIPLGEIAEILNGFAFPSRFFSKGDGTPLLRIRDVGRERTDCRYDGSFDDRYLVRDGDLVVGMDGDFRCARWRGSAALLNQRVCKISLQGDAYDPSFLDFVLPAYLRALKERTSSVTVTHLSSRSLAEIPMPLPPLAEQRRIADRLAELMGRLGLARERLARVPTILKRFRQSVLAAACSGRLTEDWRTRNLSSGGSDSRGDSLPAEWGWSNLRSQKEFSLYGPRFSSDDYSADGVPVLRTTDIDVAGKVNLQTAPRLRLTVSDLESYRLKAGDLVFTRTGSIGRVAVFNDTVDAIPGAYLIQYRLRLPMESVLYLFHFFSSRAGQQKLLEGSTGVGRPNVNAKTIDSIPIPLPPELERHEIVHRVEALFKFADVIEQRVTAAAARTARLTQTILARAFRGELVPTEADLPRREGRGYESASASLARLDAVGMSEPIGTAMITGRE